jgi:protocatechuate 3,4-dioxygenase beta subunit
VDNDDRFIGQVLNRREVMRLLAATGVATCGAWGGGLFARAGDRQAAPAGSPVPSCVVRPELDEGPFFLDQQLNRSDVRSDPASGVVSAGLPLMLNFELTQINGGRCAPLAGAVIDVWQCDAAGVYSGVSGLGQAPQAAGGKALRGFQITDAGGVGRFTTSAPAGAYEFTSQLFFDDALTDQIHATAPYSARARRTTTNSNDGIFSRGGQTLMLAPTRQANALAATFAIGVDLSDAAIGRPDGGGGRGRGPGRGRG